VTKTGFVVHLRDDRLIGAAQILAPGEFCRQLVVFGVVLDPCVDLLQLATQVDQLGGDLVPAAIG